MFSFSKFNKDISDWDVSNLIDMGEMFLRAKFSKDISKWEVINSKERDNLFDGSPLFDNPPTWYVE
jgi:hypothetical protein